MRRRPRSRLIEHLRLDVGDHGQIGFTVFWDVSSELEARLRGLDRLVELVRAGGDPTPAVARHLDIGVRP